MHCDRTKSLATGQVRGGYSYGRIGGDNWPQPPLTAQEYSDMVARQPSPPCSDPYGATGLTRAASVALVRRGQYSGDNCISTAHYMLALTYFFILVGLWCPEPANSPGITVPWWTILGVPTILITIFEIAYRGQISGKDTIIESKDEKLRLKDAVYKLEKSKEEERNKNDAHEKELEIKKIRNDLLHQKENQWKDSEEYKKRIELLIYASNRHANHSDQELIEAAKDLVNKIRNYIKKEISYMKTQEIDGIHDFSKRIYTEYTESFKSESILIREALILRREFKQDPLGNYIYELWEHNINSEIYDKPDNIEDLMSIANEIESLHNQPFKKVCL